MGVEIVKEFCAQIVARRLLYYRVKGGTKMKIEDAIFTRARLGKHWTEARARLCLAFFGAPYTFSAAREREFIAGNLTSYNWNLTEKLATA